MLHLVLGFITVKSWMQGTWMHRASPRLPDCLSALSPASLVSCQVQAFLHQVCQRCKSCLPGHLRCWSHACFPWFKHHKAWSAVLQYAAQAHALGNELDDILAAMDNLDADKTQHADFLATYHNQVNDPLTQTDGILFQGHT